MHSTPSPFDDHCMRLALELAAKGQGRVEPNPMVGCVLAKDDQIIGQGHHHAFGQPHAEIDALRSLSDANDAHGCTAYVTLEPCCHHGKTPPCADALIAAGVRRVVVAMDDPFPKVSGGGLQRLRDAGNDVSVGLQRAAAEDLNAPYLKRVRKKMPWVIAKWAMTLDGRIATVSGESQWITGEVARRSVHDLRGRVDAILTGMGTVQADDPTLTARPTDDRGNPQSPLRTATRVVFCNERLPSPQSRLMQSIDLAPLLLIASSRVDASRLSELGNAGAEVHPLDCAEPGQMIAPGLRLLGERSLTNVMLECGGKLLGGFLTPENLIDECHVYLGNTLFGGKKAPGPIAGDGIPSLSDASRFQLRDHTIFGNDIRLIYRRKD